MTGKERVTAAVEHRSPDKIPVAEDFWDDTITEWRNEGLPENVSPNDYFDFDIINLGIDASPRFEARLLKDDGEWITMQDRFGYVVRKLKHKSRTVDYQSYPVPDRAAWETVRGMFVMKPGEGSRIDDVAFPFRLTPEPAWDETRKKFRRLRDTGKYLLATAYGPHEAAWRLRGFTETLMDIVLDPEFITDIAKTYSSFLLDVLDRCIAEDIIPDGFMAIEDIAATRGMLFSPDHWRAVYKPSMKKLGDFLHGHDMHYWMHSCGNGESVFEDLIECGLDVINPLEAKSGLDVRDLKERYGERLTFYGNIDIRAMSDSEEAVEREVSGKLEAFAQGGGYIAHSDHSIPPEVSFDRYRHVIDLIRKYGGRAAVMQ